MSSNPAKTEAAQPRAGLMEKLNLERYGVYYALVVLLIAATFMGWPYFHTPANLINIMRQASYTGIIALGMTFVIISGGIDLSVGSSAVFAGSLGVILMNHLLGRGMQDSYSFLALIFVVMAVLGTINGLVNGALIAYGRIVPFITTLGTMSIYRYLSLYIGDAGEFAARSNLINQIGMSSLFTFQFAGSRVSLPLPVFVLLVLAAMLSFILNNTRYGRYLCAVGSNAKVAEYSAIKVQRVRFWAYGIIGTMVGISAFLLAGRFGTVSTNNFGIGFEMDAIAAVIIGGTAMAGGRGTVWGTVVGCFMLQIIQNMLNMAGISPYLQGVIKGIVIICSVFIQKQKQ
ncbi:MAG: ABC transporter permease [Planctomycetaceae bacterium]|nr:ABC transporter permease [Planctomycetaceae bacterium]